MSAINTAFGKELRKMRIDAGEVLKDMAEKLGVTSSYLSAIEVGKRTVSTKILQKLRDVYDLSSAKMQALQIAIEEDAPKIEMNLRTTTMKQRSTAIAFARTFKSLDEQTLENIFKLLNDGDSDSGNDI